MVFGLWSLVFGLWALVFGLWALGFSLWLISYWLSLPLSAFGTLTGVEPSLVYSALSVRT